MIQNWDQVASATEHATEATGSAAREHEKYLDSIQGRLNSLQSVWQTFSNTLMSSNFVKDIISGLASLLDVLEKLVGTIGGWATTGILAGLFLGIKNRKGISSWFGDLRDGLSGATRSFGDFGSAVGLSFGELKKFMKTPAGIATAVGAVVSIISGVISFIKKKDEELRQERQAIIDDADSFADSFGSFEQAYVKYSGKTVLTTEEENELVTAIDGTISALGEKSSALAAAAGASSEYVSGLEKIADAELKEQQRIASEAKVAAQEQYKDAISGGTLGRAKSFFANGVGEYDITLPSSDSKEFKYLEGIVNSQGFQQFKELASANGRDNDTELTYNMHFDADANIDEAIDAYNYAVQMRDALAEAAAETGDDDYISGNTYKHLSEYIDAASTSLDGMIEKTVVAEKATYQLENGIAKTESEYFAMLEEVLSKSSSSVQTRDEMGQILNEQYKDMFDLSSIESQIGYIEAVTKGIDGIDFGKTNTFEMFLNMKTKVNNGECTVGDYTDYIEQANEAINSIEDAETQEFLRVQLGLELDEDGNIEDEIKTLKDKLVRDLTNNKVAPEVAEAFANDLSKTELNAAINLIASGEIDLQNFDIDKAMDEIEEEAERAETLQFTVDVDLETENLEKLNTAVSEALSGTGLGTESMLAVENMFKGLDSYDPSKLFERTANGMRLNTDEFRKLNNEYKNTNLDGLSDKMSALGDEYNETREELSNLTYGTDEYNAKARELSDLEAQIKDVETLAAQYEGLTSAYNEWQMAESAGNQRDMYESVISGLETMEDELFRGWVDDSTTEFLELLTGEDLSTGSIDNIKAAYERLDDTIQNTTYSIKDFFTTNEDGESTSDGVYNFLDAVGQMEEEAFGGLDIVQRDGDGNIIGFDFQLAGGDDVIAEAMGVSEELVQIMVRAADDAGFVVSMDGTYQQLDVLKEKAADAALALKDTFKVTDYSFFQDGSTEGILNDYTEAMKVWDTFKANKNADGTVNMSVEGAEEAFTLVSTLQSMVDQLKEPVYMELNASEVEKEMQTPLSKLQEYETLTQTEHQLKLKGTDTSEIEASQEEILNYFEGLDPEVKAQLGIKDLSREELQKKVEAGEIEIPATVDLQVEMNDTLKDMVNVALYNAGVIDEKELEARVDVSLYAEEVDTSDVESKTESAVENAGGGDKTTETTANVDVKAGEVDTSDVENKTEEAVKNENGTTETVEKSLDVEVTVDEYREILHDLEDANKDIEINVKVNGLEDVERLNKNIDIAAEVEGNIDNISDFVESAKALSELDDNIVTYITAEVDGSILDVGKGDLEKLADFAGNSSKLKELKEVGSFTTAIDADIKAKVKGNVIEKDESDLSKLSLFAEEATLLKTADIGTEMEAEIKAEVKGNVIEKDESDFSKLGAFATEAQVLKSVDIGTDTEAKIKADVKGNVIEKDEEALGNLSAFAHEAIQLKTSKIGTDIEAKVEANVKGNVVDTNEDALDNLGVFAKEAVHLKGAKIGTDVEAEIRADVKGNVVDTNEEALNNLSAFAKEAVHLKSAKIGTDIEAKVTADVKGNVANGDAALDSLGKFVDEASVLKDIGSPTSTVTANIKGDVTDEKVTTLKGFSGVATALKSVGEIIVSVTANIATDAINGAISLLKSVSESGLFKNYNANVTVNTQVDSSGVDSYQPAPKTGKVTYEVDSSKVDAWTAPHKYGDITYTPYVPELTDSQKNKKGTITYKANVVGFPVANGTAYANGTAGRAFKQGDWSIKDSGTALMGELGPELIVRDGRFFTVGDNGAEFATYKKGDIIFNHKQTEELFKNGYVTSGGGRGRAFVEGTAFDGGSTGYGGWRPGGNSSSSSSSSSSKSSSSKSNSSSSSSANEEAEEFSEVLDWIEVKIDRIERAISRLDLKASSTFKKWTTRNSALVNEIAKVGEEIEIQNAGYDRYMQEAASVGLSSEYQRKVQNGEIDIETITDEDLKEKIDEYQQWYI